MHVEKKNYDLHIVSGLRDEPKQAAPLAPEQLWCNGLAIQCNLLQHELLLDPWKRTKAVLEENVGHDAEACDSEVHPA